MESSNALHDDDSCLDPGRLATLWQDKALSDVTIVAEGKKFSAHKVILALGSPVFFRMFASNYVEKDLTEVVLQDITILKV